MNSALTEKEIAVLTARFPELSWMKPRDWLKVASFSDWRSWIDEMALNETPRPENWPDYVGILDRLLSLRLHRHELRKDCRSYFGEENVPNINDPEEETWA